MKSDEPAEQKLDERTKRYLSGRCLCNKGWIICWSSTYSIALLVLVLLAQHDKLLVAYSTLCTILLPALVIGILFISMGQKQEVALGLLIDFFWWGGLGSFVASYFLELFSIKVLWPHISPGCILSSSKERPQSWCQLWQICQWILTVGLWEETFKVVWILLRLRTQPLWVDSNATFCSRLNGKAVPRTVCCCFPTVCCTFWWRLAERPVTVFLCSVAAAGGFQAIENVQYMVRPILASNEPGQNITAAMITIILRALLPLHMLWTGFVGIRLGQRFFSEPDKQPWVILGALLPVMIIHGFWDWLVSQELNIWLKFALISLVIFISACICYVPIQSGALRYRPSEQREVVEPKIQREMIDVVP